MDIQTIAVIGLGSLCAAFLIRKFCLSPKKAGACACGSSRGCSKALASKCGGKG